MASRLQDVLLRGTAASRPLATAVAPGTLYFSTDTTTTDRSDGTTWQTYADVAAAAARTGSISLIIDGGGSAITTGVKAYLEVPVACTITVATLLADVSGSVVIDLWKVAYASYPPTVTNTITASAKPTISSAVKSRLTTLTGWTTAVSAGDILAVNVDSASTIKKLTVSLTITVP